MARQDDGSLNNGAIIKSHIEKDILTTVHFDPITDGLFYAII